MSILGENICKNEFLKTFLSFYGFHPGSLHGVTSWDFSYLL
jgi:hypothetical protein